LPKTREGVVGREVIRKKRALLSSTSKGKPPEAEGRGGRGAAPGVCIGN